MRIKKDHFKQKLLFWLQVSFKYIKSTIINNLKDLLTELEGFKSLTTLALEFKKLESEDERKYSTLCLSSTVETIINGSDIDDVFESIYCMIISKMYWKRFKLDYLFSCRSLSISQSTSHLYQRFLRKGSGWIIYSVIGRTIYTSKYKPLSGRSYINYQKI